jgi:hypothetical protein
LVLNRLHRPDERRQVGDEILRHAAPAPLIRDSGSVGRGSDRPQTSEVLPDFGSLFPKCCEFPTCRAKQHRDGHSDREIPISWSEDSGRDDFASYCLLTATIAPVADPSESALAFGSHPKELRTRLNCVMPTDSLLLR